jgi:hypothetical protein
MSSVSNLVLPRTVDSRAGEFRFDAPTHQYWLGNKVLPGITGILRTCGYIDVTYYTLASRERGSHVHQAIHFLNKGTLDWEHLLDQFESGQSDYAGYVIGYEKFVKDWNLKLEYFERPMYHPDLLFGGTPDLVGTCLDNVPCIVELKTGPVMKWTALQTAAQELLVRAWEQVPVRRRRWGVTLNADGTYSKPVPFNEWERDEAVFRTLNSAVQYRELYGA